MIISRKNRAFPLMSLKKRLTSGAAGVIQGLFPVEILDQWAAAFLWK